MTLENLKRELLSAHRIGRRLHKSLKSTEHLFPLDVDGLKAIDDGEQEKIDALLLRFVSLASAIQDRIARSVLLLEEEDLTTASRKDMRLMLEKTGAIRKGREFGVIAELRNVIAHVYPEDFQRQVAILNLVHRRGKDLLGALEDLSTYACRKFFDTNGCDPSDTGENARDSPSP